MIWNGFLHFSVGNAQLITKHHDFQVFVGFRHPADLNAGDGRGEYLYNQEPNHKNKYSKLVNLAETENGAYFHAYYAKITSKLIFSRKSSVILVFA